MAREAFVTEGGEDPWTSFDSSESRTQSSVCLEGSPTPPEAVDSPAIPTTTLFTAAPLSSMKGTWRQLAAVLLGVHCLFSVCVQARKPPGEDAEPDYWRHLADQELDSALTRQFIEAEAKNVILFLGDGMSLSTVTAARIFKGQIKGNNGEEEILAFERFPNVALAKTYNVDHQVPDSAATATAFLCGVKANYGTIGLDGRVPRGDCPGSKGRNLTCLAEIAQRAGKSTGIVTTGRITHATVAPLYSSSPDRMWEDDSLLPVHIRHQGCRDIGSQFVDHVGRSLDVVLGGGRKNLMPETEQDPEYGTYRGQRKDRRNLIDEWVAAKRAAGDPRPKYVWNKAGFDAVDHQKTDSLIGVFEYSHMKFDGDRAKDPDNEPCLADMVEKAIRILSRNRRGFVLLIEAARIDHGHHENTARRALEETVAMEMAVRRALSLVHLKETLLIVTADHSHPLAIGSYAMRGNPILGLTDFSDDATEDGLSDVDYMPYTTLSYANGPGFSKRINLTGVDTQTREYRQITAVPTQIVSHEGSDVPIYATGAMAHLFHTTHEQNYIFRVITFAACLDQKPHKHCARPVSPRRAEIVVQCPLTSGAPDAATGLGFQFQSSEYRFRYQVTLLSVAQTLSLFSFGYYLT